MCGIIGILFSDSSEDSLKRKMGEEMILGLKRVLHRGYDSVGISFIEKDEILKTCIEGDNDPMRDMTDLVDQHYHSLSSINAIGHTRWATHGEVNLINSHPHKSWDDRFRMVHNGIVKNMDIFDKHLKSEGIVMVSQTDSERLVQMIGWMVRKKGNVHHALQEVLSMVDGGYALVLQDRQEPHMLYCARRTFPLLMTRRKDGCIVVSSEISGLGSCRGGLIMEPYDDYVMCLDDKEWKEEQGRFLNQYLSSPSSPSFKMELKAQYSSWTEQEIMEQPMLVQKILAKRVSEDGTVVLSELKEAVREEIVQNRQQHHHLFLVGCGTSYHAAMASAKWFRETGLYETVHAYDAVDFDMSVIPSSSQVTWILLSQSGETMDLIVLLEKIPSSHRIFGLFNARDCLLARQCQQFLYIMAGRERGVASTKAFTCQVLHMYLFSRWLSHTKISRDVQDISHGIQETIKIFPQLEKWSHKLSLFQSLLILGRGDGLFVARESALKMKELSRIHTESFSSGSLKHGPFALLDENMPVLFIHTSDNPEEKTLLSLHEILSRKSPVFLLYPEGMLPNLFYHPQLLGLSYPSSPHEMSFLYPVILLQELSIRISIKKGFRVDFPRNLAKTVTVE